MKCKRCFINEIEDDDKGVCNTCEQELEETIPERDENFEKFECADCGCYYWVADRNHFNCPNCEDKNEKI